MKMKLNIAAVAQHTPQVKSFKLESTDGSPLPPFTAGAHLKITVALPDGTTSTRAYSIASDERDSASYVIGVLREATGRGGSAYMHEALSVGSVLEAEGPVNNFPLIRGARKSLLIAGGIGITPILSMARTLRANDEAFDLAYFGREGCGLAFIDDARELGCSEFYCGEVEEVRTLIRQLLSACDTDCHVYVCGPTGLINSVLELAQFAGLNPSHMHYEMFGAGVVGLVNSPFKVILVQSNRTISVPADRTLLDVLIEEGVDPSYDCKAGTCGSCLVSVAGGVIEHRDTFLSDEDKQEGALMCTCVSRAITPELQLDM